MISYFKTAKYYGKQNQYDFAYSSVVSPATYHVALSSTNYSNNGLSYPTTFASSLASMVLGIKT
jgi:hypothetical protein